MEIQATLSSDFAMVFDSARPTPATFLCRNPRPSQLDGLKDAGSGMLIVPLTSFPTPTQTRKRTKIPSFREATTLLWNCQGSSYEDLRAASARDLAMLDFDGYAVGISVGEPGGNVSCGRAQ